MSRTRASVLQSADVRATCCLYVQESQFTVRYPGESMNYVQKIKSNLKGAIEVDLGPRTIIIGENASGKSSIINSISLALTGEIEDDSGRVIKQELNLFALHPDRKGDLYAIAVLANGGEARYETSGSVEAAKRARHQLPASIDKAKVFPLRQIKPLLVGSVDALQEFFLGALSSTLTEADVLSVIPPTLHASFTEVAGTGNHGKRLLRALEVAASKKKGASARKREAENTITVKSVGLPPPVGEGEVARLREQMELENRVLESVSSTAVIPRNTLLESVLSLLREHVAHNSDECAVCGHVQSPDDFLTRLGVLETQTARVEIKQAHAETDRMRASIATAMYNKAMQANEAWSAVNEARNAVVASEQAVARWKIFEDACSTAVASLLASATTRLETRVQAFLPASDQFGVLLAYGERSMCAFGLKRNGFLDTSLSGAEWARVTAALGCALSEGELRVIVPEDRSMSPATLTSVLDAFGESPVQIILATTTEPTRIPKSWTVVRL